VSAPVRVSVVAGAAATEAIRYARLSPRAPRINAGIKAATGSSEFDRIVGCIGGSVFSTLFLSTCGADTGGAVDEADVEGSCQSDTPANRLKTG
jgi:hypothetical protein